MAQPQAAAAIARPNGSLEQSAAQSGAAPHPSMFGDPRLHTLARSVLGRDSVDVELHASRAYGPIHKLEALADNDAGRLKPGAPPIGLQVCQLLDELLVRDRHRHEAAWEERPPRQRHHHDLAVARLGRRRHQLRTPGAAFVAAAGAAHAACQACDAKLFARADRQPEARRAAHAPSHKWPLDAPEQLKVRTSGM
jgi:hypothetical protein